MSGGLQDSPERPALAAPLGGRLGRPVEGGQQTDPWPKSKGGLVESGGKGNAPGDLPPPPTVSRDWLSIGGRLLAGGHASLPGPIHVPCCPAQPLVFSSCGIRGLLTVSSQPVGCHRQRWKRSAVQRKSGGRKGWSGGVQVPRVCSSRLSWRRRGEAQQCAVHGGTQNLGATMVASARRGEQKAAV